MKKHWLTLHDDTFLWLKEKTGFVYNTINKKRFIFSLSDNIEKICYQLLKTENLYTVEVSEENIHDPEMKRWIDSFQNIQAGYLSLNVEFDKRPVSLKPILKIQDSRKHYEDLQKLGYRGKILQNLHELTFYIKWMRLWK